MSGYKDFISVNIIGLDEAVSRLNALPATIDAALHDTKTLSEIGTQLLASGRRTIAEGGRPSRYKPLAASTIARKKSSTPLINKGTLRQSLSYDVEGGSLYLTSVGYLKYHQFEEGRTKARFPARPVWGVQDEDNDEITDIIVAGIQRNL